jgi:uncharacterized lipoprotein YddW (UPF0748 family)
MTEDRGVWIHHTTARAVGGARVARECHEHGLNLLMPRVPWLSGTTAEPEYWERVMDPMIKEAHRLEMEVHAWIFFLNEASVDNRSSLMQVQESGKVEYAACAGNPEVVELNLGKIEPILSNYELDGFNLEDCFVYHRWSEDPLICFCDYCRHNAPEGFDARMAWNRDKLTSLLVEIVKESRRHSKELKISAAARVPYETHSMPMSADWKQWCEMGLLDLVAFMVYQKDADEVRQLSADAVKLIEGTGTPVDIGLGAYILDRELTGHELPSQLSEQLDVVKEVGVNGHIFYHLGGITRDQFVLMEQAYNLPA